MPAIRLTVLAALVMFHLHPVLAAEPRVLIVHSYHASQKEHVVEMNRGIGAALADLPLEQRFYYMDTKRRTSEEWKKEAGREAGMLMAQFRPQVVITMDDNAQEYFARSHAGAPAPPYFVFGGLNGEPARYGFPAANVTGVLERPIVGESIKLLQKIVPSVNKLLILSDKSETTDAFVAFCKSLSLPATVVAYEQPRTLDEFRAVLENYRGQVDAIGLYVIRTIARSAADPSKVPEQELVGLINGHYRIPTVGFYDSAAESGLLCAISVSMWEQGYEAGLITRGILAGKKPADYPVRSTGKGRIQLNLRTAEQLGLQLPYELIKRAEVVIR